MLKIAKVIQIPIDVYKTFALVFVGCDKQEVMKRLAREFEEEEHKPLLDEYYNGDLEGACLRNGKIGVVLLKDWDNIPVMAHELFHMTNDLLSARGVCNTENNDEASAYLLEYLMGGVLKTKKNF